MKFEDKPKKGLKWLKKHWREDLVAAISAALVAAETHRTTIEEPKLTDIDDIDFKDYKEFSNRFSLKEPGELVIRNFFTRELIGFFEKMDIYHLESSGRGILVFKYLRLASPSELMKMHHFSKQLVRRLKIKSSPHPDYVKKDE